MRPSIAVSALLSLSLLGAGAPAEADDKSHYDARTDRLAGLRQDDLERLAPHLARGPVALIEFANSDADELPGINFALLVHANAAVVEALISDPTGYPKFMPTIDSVQVVERHGTAIVYDWAFNLAVLRMRGRNLMTVYRPLPNQPDAATRITVDNQEGDLGQGRMLFRVHPRGPETCILVVSMRVDLREANYIARQMATAARSVNRSANLALACSMALHFRREAEHRTTTKDSSSGTGPLVTRQVDVHMLARLLDRGDLVLFSMSGDRLDQLTVLGVVEQSMDKVQAALRNARAFGSELVPGAAATIVSEAHGITIFDWSIDLPLVGVSGRMRMDERKPVVSVDATSGALHGGHWLFDVTSLAKRVTLVNASARFDFTDSTWLLEKLISADPDLGHGITAASEVMLVRALRSRATEL